MYTSPRRDSLAPPTIHCSHCVDHENRLEKLERSEIIRDATLSFLRWIVPIFITIVGIYLATIWAGR